MEQAKEQEEAEAEQKKKHEEQKDKMLKNQMASYQAATRKNRTGSTAAKFGRKLSTPRSGGAREAEISALPALAASSPAPLNIKVKQEPKIERGWLAMKKEDADDWVLRYFVLHGGCLHCFPHELVAGDAIDISIAEKSFDLTGDILIVQKLLMLVLRPSDLDACESPDLCWLLCTNSIADADVWRESMSIVKENAEAESLNRGGSAFAFAQPGASPVPGDVDDDV